MSLPASFPLQAANGKTISLPSPGFGTWAAGDTTWAKESILSALKAGYRHLDCAWMYGVDGAIGDAIRESGIPREEIFITTKFWPHFGHPDDVGLCLDLCLEGMGLEYVDCYLSHWPVVWKSAGREALENAKTGPNVSNDDKGIVYDKGVPVIDFARSPANVAAQKGLVQDLGQSHSCPNTC
jgi:diketogulonate reductase-like aldo/keto reductase